MPLSAPDAGPALQLNVTLRRAHHLSERIGEQMAQLRGDVARNAPATNVRGYHGEEQERQLRAKAFDAVAALRRHQLFAAAQARIRARLARANVESGVSGLLAKIEAKKKQLALLRSFLEHKPDADVLSVEALRTWTPPEGIRLGGSAALVSALDAQTLRRMDAEREQLERELFALSDELAELNARKVDIDIPATLAEALGLGPASASATDPE